MQTKRSGKENPLLLYYLRRCPIYPVIEVDEFLEKKISNGVKINNIFNIKNKVIFKNKNNKLLGIYELDNNKLKVWKNFN